MTRDLGWSSTWDADADGRSTLIPCTAAVVSRMKMISSTKVRSTRGVMLISL
ncbi:hypothetical protein D3C78_1745010 [compost metagenome]